MHDNLAMRDKEELPPHTQMLHCLLLLVQHSDSKELCRVVLDVPDEDVGGADEFQTQMRFLVGELLSVSMDEMDEMHQMHQK